MNDAQTQLNMMTLGEIAAKIPGATAIFRRYDLDFCCAGKQYLGDALAAKRLDQAAIMSELEALFQRTTNTGIAKSPAKDMITEDDASLIDYIITRFHDVHRQQFPELIRLSNRVEKVHGEHDLCPKGLEAHLTAMFSDLSLHMQKEEQILFPMLRDGNRDMAADPIAMMESEHEDHGRALTTIRVLTHNGVLPDNACNTWRALYQGLAQLEEDLIQHIHLENNILFAR